MSRVEVGKRGWKRRITILFDPAEFSQNRAHRQAMPVAPTPIPERPRTQAGPRHSLRTIASSAPRRAAPHAGPSPALFARAGAGRSAHALCDIIKAAAMPSLSIWTRVWPDISGGLSGPRRVTEPRNRVGGFCSRFSERVSFLPGGKLDGVLECDEGIKLYGMLQYADSQLFDRAMRSMCEG